MLTDVRTAPAVQQPSPDWFRQAEEAARTAVLPPPEAPAELASEEAEQDLNQYQQEGGE